MPCSLNHFRQLIEHHPPTKRLWIAYSGGVDSHALLHFVAHYPDLPIPIAGALHINHTLHIQSDLWEQHCQRVCKELGLSYCSRVVEPSAGAGPEDQARRVRYQAFKSILQAGDAILLAHHQDDQAETVLLQALRGGGARGLAGMAEIATLGLGRLVRPFLQTTRHDILLYAKQHQLQWIEDDSNDSRRFDRNYLRHEIMPLLKKRWPASAKTLSRTAHHNASLVHLSQALLKQQLPKVLGRQINTLSITQLLKQPTALQIELIRLFCDHCHLTRPASKNITELLKQLQAKKDRQIAVAWRGGLVRRYQDELFFFKNLPSYHTQWCYLWDTSKVLLINEINHQLTMTPALLGEGVSARFANKALMVCSRKTGIKCQALGDSHHRSLKVIYKQHHIPPWDRNRYPMIFYDKKLLGIGGLVICNEFKATDNEAGLIPVLSPIH